jgi:DNA repair exonuclease SbcCD ATPase subunit
MSYGANWTEVKFEENVSNFLIGENLDTKSGNGSGKSSLLNCITYAFYNKPFNNISLPKLVNSTNALKNTLMEVEMEFKKGPNLYSIYRKRGESHGIVVLKNGEDITPDSVNETDNMIENIIGLSYDLFTRIIVFAGSTIPFLDLPVSAQRAQIEELFNISLLSEKAINLKKHIHTTEADIKVQEAIIKEKNNTKKAHERRLSDLIEKIENWENNRISKIKSIEKKLIDIEEINFEKEQELYSKREELEIHINKISSELKTLKTNLSNKKTNLKNKINELNHLKDNQCPYCLQDLPDSIQKLSSVENEIAELSIEINKLEESNVDKTEDLNALESELKGVKSEIMYDNLPDLVKTKTNKDLMLSELKGLEEAENPYFDTYELLEKEDHSVNTKVLDELKYKLEHQVFLHKLLTDKNSFIRRKIISKTIPFLNIQMNHYASILGLPHIINFRDDMSCSVSEYGRELDFGNLSSGEKKRVNLAMSLAFRDVWHHLHYHINFLFLDEIDYGMCDMGIDLIIDLIKEKTKEDELSTWIVMHKPQAVGKFDKDIIVRKENGFSSLIYK